MLAGILAFLDTNDNLKLLQANDSQWKIELWYTFLRNQEVLNLQVCICFIFVSFPKHIETLVRLLLLHNPSFTIESHILLWKLHSHTTMLYIIISPNHSPINDV